MNARKPKPGMSGVFKCSTCSAATVPSPHTNAWHGDSQGTPYVPVIYGDSAHGGQTGNTDEIVSCYILNEKLSALFSQGDHKT